jgi:hypothetical protein
LYQKRITWKFQAKVTYDNWDPGHQIWEGQDTINTIEMQSLGLENTSPKSPKSPETSPRKLNVPRMMVLTSPIMRGAFAKNKNKHFKWRARMSNQKSTRKSAEVKKISQVFLRILRTENISNYRKN